jgi:hypothetical protein
VSLHHRLCLWRNQDLSPIRLVVSGDGGGTKNEIEESASTVVVECLD